MELKAAGAYMARTLSYEVSSRIQVFNFTGHLSEQKCKLLVSSLLAPVWMARPGMLSTCADICGIRIARICCTGPVLPCAVPHNALCRTPQCFALPPVGTSHVTACLSS